MTNLAIGLGLLILVLVGFLRAIESTWRDIGLILVLLALLVIGTAYLVDGIEAINHPTAERGP